MAGVGLRLNRIFEKKSIAADIAGFTYSIIITIAPTLVVILGILLMGRVLGFNEVPYLERELFSCTVLYVFIFSLLVVSAFNAVLSKYVQDAIYEERYQDILPCYYIGLVLTLAPGSILGAVFCLREHFVGGVDVFFTFVGFCAYICMILVFYSMIYLSVCKDYEKISLFFFLGTAVGFLISLALRFLLEWEIAESMLLALALGFLLIAVMEFSAVKRYFQKNSNRYKPVLRYFARWWKLVVTNFFYVFGLYVHNFVFWTGDDRRILVRSFVFNQPYDMASCLALFTNLSATVIFVTHMEMHFYGKYRAYSEAVIGGKKADIENAKKRMFRQLGNELMNLVRVQFIISVVVYLLCVVFLPQFGFAGTIMRIYPSLAAGYFILFLMYAALLLLYYFNDLTGAVMTVLSFFAVTLFGSIYAINLAEIWYGVGLVAGSFVGWTVAYMRLRWMEKHLDTHIFCQGFILKKENKAKPSGLVYRRKDKEAEAVK